MIAKVLKNCRMDSGRHKGFQWKIKCLFRHLSHLFSSSAEFTVCYFSSEKKKLVSSVHLFLLLWGGTGRGVQGENFSGAAWAELRKGLLEYSFPPLPLPTLVVYLKMFCYFSVHAANMDVTVLTEICFETKFSRISVVESILKTECSEVQGINKPKLAPETSLLYICEKGASLCW